MFPLTTTAAHLEDVPRAVNIACVTPARYVIGFFLVTRRYSNGRTMSPCIKSPLSTVAMKSPKDSISSAQLSTEIMEPRMRKKIPMGPYL